ncbi:hypothetical protein SELMODRAFT_411128 [Selaginella moellendorffii]|uniref:F-box domain-containing protein n=1 Tax=Selaginella moellendorffii TaxID=88036 RepID=D8RGN4_SELML|nr:hypothetical protein SELMODRAFT_411128 [Selaginella moellendorffii]
MDYSLLQIIEEEVLVRLSAGLLHTRVRLVCKQWKDLIDSPRFKSLHHKYHSGFKGGERSPPIILGLECNGSLAKCNPFGQERDKDWIVINPLPELRFYLLSCAGGLMFGRITSNKSYVTLNPLTGDLKVLPPPPLEPLPSTAIMATHTSRQRYWICISYMRVVYLYDSSVGIWQEVSLPEGWKHHCYAKAINNKVYYYCRGLDHVDTGLMGVLSLDLESLSWSTEWEIHGYSTPSRCCIDFLVSPALEFFKVTVDSMYHLSRLDAASKGFVEEVGLPLNMKEGMSHVPSCCYKDTIVVAGPKQLEVLDYKTKSWTTHKNKKFSRFDFLFLFTSSLFDPKH